jgi:pantetheine-phosphate adenylyltransferase
LVDSFEGLLVEYLKRTGRRIVVRGLRAISDYDYEAQMALMNKNLLGDMETIFLMAREEHSYVSSSLVKQIAPLGGEISKLVSPGVEKILRSRYSLKDN